MIFVKDEFVKKKNIFIYIKIIIKFSILIAMKYEHLFHALKNIKFFL